MERITEKPSIQLRVVSNPFKRTDQTVHHLSYQPCSLKELKEKYIPVALPFLCIRNGEVIHEEMFEKTHVSASDSLLFMPEVQGGGGDGEKNVLSSMMMLAVTFAAPYVIGPISASGAAAGSTASMFSSAVSSMVGKIGGMVVNAMFSSGNGNIPTVDSSSLMASQSYSWNPQTTQQEGMVIGKFYGTNKLHGNIIAANTAIDPATQEQFLNILIDLGVGPYHHIEDIRINDQPIANFHDVQYVSRLGDIRQAPLSMFKDTKKEHPLSLTINNSQTGKQNFVTYNIPLPALFNALEFDITFPQGLFAISNSSSSLQERTAQMKWEIFSGSSEVPLISSEIITIRSSARKVIRRSFSTEDDNLHKENFTRFSPQETYKLKVTKINPDAPPETASELMVLTAVRELFYDDFTYPRHALVGLHAKATGQISGSLRFSCLADTAKIITFNKAENNTDWHFGFSSNPAEICFDILCQPLFRDGINTTTTYTESNLTASSSDPQSPIIRYDGIPPNRIDIEAFREWARWCNEPVAESSVEVTDTLSSGLIASYTFDDDSLLDATGNAHHASKTAQVSFNHQITLSGNASIEFPDRVHTEQLLLPHFAQTGITSALSIACWLYIDTLPADGSSSALLNTDNTHGIFSAIESNGQLLFSQKGISEIRSFTTLSPKTWHFIAITNAHNGVQRLYINGKLDAEISALSSFTLMQSGTLFFGNEKRKHSPYRGKLDALHIWERALNEREVERLYTLSSQGISSFLTTKQAAKEPRCAFHGGFDFAMTLWDAALHVCKNGRAMLVWNGTKLTVAIERAVDTPTQLFNVSNMLKNSFKEVFLPLSDRSRNIEIDFINKEKGYKRDKISLNDPESDGGKPVSLQILGITSPTQAMRAAKLQLAQNRYILRTVSFETDIDAIACTVGDVVHIQHDIPQWGYGGRIISVDANTPSITIDRDVTILPNTSYRLLIRHRNDAIASYPLVNYSTGLESGSSLELDATSFTNNINNYGLPKPDDIYAFGTLEKTTKPFRITSLSRTADMHCKVLAVEYNRSIYDIDFGLSPLPLPNSSLLAQEALPQLAHLFITDEDIQNRLNSVNIIVSFLKRGAVHAVNWQVRKKTNIANHANSLLFTGTTETEQFSFEGIDSETYVIEITPLSWAGKKGEVHTLTHTALKNTPPLDNSLPKQTTAQVIQDVSGLQASFGKKEIMLSWEENNDPLRASFEIILERTFTVSQVVYKEKQRFITTATTFTYPIPYKGGDFIFSLSALSSTGEKSITPAVVTSSLNPMDDNLILSGSVDISQGSFSGEICTNDFQDGNGYVLFRPSLAGSPLSLPVVNQNDGDFYNVIDAFTSNSITSFQYPVSWWSQLQYSEKSRWESGVISLQSGTSVSGRIGIDYKLEEKMIAIAECKPSVSQLSRHSANDFIQSGHFHITLLVSDDQLNWIPIIPNSQTTATYLKIVIELNNRNPSTELKLSGLEYFLDVPDITDSGSETITASQLPFTGTLSSAYQKSFNAVSYVSVVTSSGDGVVTVNSFDTSGINVSITGTTNTTIHWIAQGY